MTWRILDSLVLFIVSWTVGIWITSPVSCCGTDQLHFKIDHVLFTRVNGVGIGSTWVEKPTTKDGPVRTPISTARLYSNDRNKNPDQWSGPSSTARLYSTIGINCIRQNYVWKDQERCVSPDGRRPTQTVCDNQWICVHVWVRSVGRGPEGETSPELSLLSDHVCDT